MEFPDGQVKEYAANIIAENMLTQVDSDGMSATLMEAIVDLRKDDKKALQHHDNYVQTKNGRRHLRKTRKGWELLLIKWKDKSESWIKLADMKESHPIEVAEYARARGIDKEPAFEWWVPHTLKKGKSSYQDSRRESERQHTSMVLKSLQVLSMPLNLTGRMAITYGRMLLKWKCTTLVLHLKS